MRVPTAFAFAFASALLFAQSAPIQMGLWEKKMTITHAGLPPENMNSRSCVTPETWQQMINNGNKPRPGCTHTVDKTAHGYTFHFSCTTGGSVMEGHGELTIQDSEHTVSEMQMTSVRNGKKQESVFHSTMRRLSADCGTVKPGEPEDID